MSMGQLIRGRTGALFALALVCLLALSGFTVVRDDEQAVIVRVNQPARAGGEGVIFRLPFLDRLERLPRGLIDVTSEGLAVTGIDQQTLVLDTDATVRIVDPVRLITRLGSVDGIGREIGSRLPAMLREDMSQLDSARIQLPGSAGATARLSVALDRAMRDFGVQVVDLRIGRALLQAGAQRSALEAMRERRELLARDEQSRGAREAQAIVAQARADAAATLQASAGRDPEFYDFYRAMRSCEAVFADPERKNKATIVLSPGNGYLCQFNAP